MDRSSQQKSELPPPGPGRRGWRNSEVLRSVEARILSVGLGLAIVTPIALGLGWLVYPDGTAVYATMTGLNMTVGRAAGMSFGYASGMNHVAVISSNMLTETIQVLVLYPLFVLGWDNVVGAHHLRRFLVEMRRSAEASRPRVARYGMIGLFAFVFLPFWMTGPVVGAIIGFLIGLKPRQNLGTVLAATYAAVGIWALFFERMNALTAGYGRYAAFSTVLVLGAAAIAVRSVQLWRRDHPRSAADDSPGTAGGTR